MYVHSFCAFFFHLSAEAILTKGYFNRFLFFKDTLCMYTLHTVYYRMTDKRYIFYIWFMPTNVLFMCTFVQRCCMI